MQELIDTKTAARLLSFAPNTLSNWRIRGGGPRYIRIGRRVRYAQADLRTWLDAQTRCSNTGQGNVT
jgi:predicted DNA-binding transcriptional regulator AlpA